jgi:hypothetical protein
MGGSLQEKNAIDQICLRNIKAVAGQAAVVAVLGRHWAQFDLRQ